MILLNWQKIYRKKHAKGSLGPGAGFLQKNAFPAYLVRPQAGETSHKKQLSCEGQGNPLPLYQYPKRANPLFPSRRAGRLSKNLQEVSEGPQPL